MSAEFRQRTPAEYLNILRRRKWLIILPVVAVVAASSYAIYKLPNIFRSSTLIVVKQSTLPTSVIPTSTEEALTRQLAGISQVVTSRSSLEPLVEKYQLYKAERLRGEPMESILLMVGSDIKVEVNTSRNDITNGFDISFKYRDPRIAQAVTSELAGQYINVQQQEQQNNAKSALQFINNQVEQTKGELDEIDGRRLKFMQDNLLNLPSQGTSLLGQLTSLREQQKAMITELGRLQDRRSSVAAQLTLMEKSAQQTIDNLSQDLTDPKTTHAWAELVNRKAELQGELQQLLTLYKPKHPDVVAKQAQIASVEKDMDAMLADWKSRIAERKKRLENSPDLQINAMKLEIKNLDNEIARQQKIQATTEAQRRSRACRSRSRVFDEEGRLRQASHRTTEDRPGHEGLPGTAVTGNRSYRRRKPSGQTRCAEKTDARRSGPGGWFGNRTPARRHFRDSAPDDDSNQRGRASLHQFAGADCGS
jgi:uncharacterized protein involved in exopolysaccharide biosynthesis